VQSDEAVDFARDVVYFLRKFCIF